MNRYANQYTLLLLPILAGVQVVSAVESEPSNALVGHKPTFTKFEFERIDIKSGEQASIDYIYNDIDGDEVSPIPTKFKWYIDGVLVPEQWGSKYTIPAGHGGKKLIVKAAPASVASAFPAVGDEQATQELTIGSVPALSPTLFGWPQPGRILLIRYLYNDDGGPALKTIKYQFGLVGTTSKLDNAMQTNDVASLQTPDYIIPGEFSGKKIEWSIQAVNMSGVASPVYTETVGVADAMPVKGTVKITYDNPSTIELSSVVGHPVVNKSTLTAEYKVASSLDANAKYFHFNWKIDGKTVQEGNGLNTYKAPVTQQNKTVTVDVMPYK
ncbi:MAG: hypothetical protein ACRDA8_13030 [Shewanella sp.]